MKIIFYIDTMGRGGAQRVMCNLVNYFAKRDYEVILINDAKLEKDVPVYDVENRITRYYLKENFEGNPIKKNIERIVNLKRIIKREKPKVVVSFLGNCNKRMLLATIGLKCKKIVSVRNDPRQEYGDSRIKRLIARNLFKLADGCIFQTREAKEYFPVKVQEKSAIIFNPVDKLFFDTIKLDETKGIVTFGRLEKQKNHKLLIDAYEKVYKRCSDNLYIYGEGPLREEIQSYIAQKGLEERVFLPGNIANVNEILASAKVFVLTSDYEGMPNALMEALAVGVPAISTDCPCGGARELLEKVPEAMLVPCNDAEKLSQAIGVLLSSKEKRRRLSEGERQAAENYRGELIMGRWEKYIDKIIS